MDETQEMRGMDISQQSGQSSTGETVYSGVSGEFFGEPPRKKKNKLILAGAAAVGLAVVIGVIVFAGSVFLQNGQKKFVTALVKAMASKPEEEEDLFGFEQMAEMVKETPYGYGGSLVLESSNISEIDAYSGLGFEMELGVDYDPVRQGMAKFMVLYGGMDMAGLTYYLDPQTIKLALPGLSDRLMVFDYQEGFEDRLASSYMIRSMGMSADEIQEFADMLTVARETMERGEPEEKTDASQMAERFRSAVNLANRLEKEMKVERADSKSFTIDGKETTCTGYTAVISHDTLMAICQDIETFILEDEEASQIVFEYLEQMKLLVGGGMVTGDMEDLESDLDRLLDRLDDSIDEIEMKGYIDRSGNMASLTIETSLDVDGDEMDFSEEILWKGGAYLAENMEVTVHVEDYYDDVEINLSREGSSENGISDVEYKLIMRDDGEKILTATFGTIFDRDTKEASVEALVRADQSYISVDMKAEGVFDEIEKGKGFHFDLDNLRVRAVGATMNYSGEIYCGPIDGLEIPEGEEFDLLTDNEMDWQILAMEIFDKLEELTYNLGY